MLEDGVYESFQKYEAETISVLLRKIGFTWTRCLTLDCKKQIVLGLVPFTEIVFRCCTSHSEIYDKNSGKTYSNKTKQILSHSQNASDHHRTIFVVCL